MIIAAEVARQEASAEAQRAALRQEVACIDAALAKCDRESKRWDEAYAAEIVSLEELKAYRRYRHAPAATHGRTRTAQGPLEVIGQAAGQAKQLGAFCAQVFQQLQP